jgi:hypothetical protein
LEEAKSFGEMMKAFYVVALSQGLMVQLLHGNVITIFNALIYIIAYFLGNIFFSTIKMVLKIIFYIK